MERALIRSCWPLLGLVCLLMNLLLPGAAPPSTGACGATIVGAFDPPDVAEQVHVSDVAAPTAPTSDLRPRCDFGDYDSASGSLLAAKGGTAAANRAENVANGIPESALGPSGKPKVHVKEHSTRKQAKDAARNEGKWKPVQHPSPKEGGPHFHPTDADGNKVPGKTHHEYPKK